MSVSSTPSELNNDDKSPMESDVSDPIEKEKHVEKEKQVAIDIAL